MHPYQMFALPLNVRFLIIIRRWLGSVLDMKHQRRIDESQIIVALGPEDSHLADRLVAQLSLVLHQEVSECCTVG